MMANGSPGYWTILRPHILSAFACLPLVSAGISIGYSATTLPQLRAATNNNATFTLEPNQATWFVSMVAATAPLGGLLAVSLLDQLGRRAMLLACDIPALLGWLLVARAPHTSTPLAELYVARGLAGFSCGMAVASCTVYLTEVIAPRCARPLTAWPGIALCLGLLTSYVLGALLPWSTAAYAAAVPSLVALVAALYLPESPAWLRHRGRPGDADWALQKLRLPALPSTPAHPCPGCSADSKKHDNCLFCADRFQDPSTSQPQGDTSCLTTFQVCCSKKVLKNFAIQVVLVLFQQLNGTLAILAYLVDILNGLNVSVLSPYNIAILCGILVLSSNVVVGILEPRFGIRQILLFCGAGMALSMLFLSFHLTLLQVGGEAVSLYYNWIPFAAILFFVFFGSAWLVVFPWLELGEQFPTRVRSTVGFILFLLTFAIYFVNLQYFPGIASHFKFEMTRVWYYLFLVSVLQTIFGFIFWPKSQYSLGVMSGVVVTPMYTVIPEEERLFNSDNVSQT